MFLFTQKVAGGQICDSEKSDCIQKNIFSRAAVKSDSPPSLHWIFNQIQSQEKIYEPLDLLRFKEMFLFNASCDINTAGWPEYVNKMDGFTSCNAS